jgi:methylmalonyl-CoA/ethylmalonyl-CoA epimerase
LEELRAILRHAKAIDHVAIAVEDLDRAAAWYTGALGMTAEEEKVTQGEKSAMRSRVVRGGGLTFVLVQGTHPESNVSQYIAKYGPGVQHVAILVDDMAAVYADLKQHIEFDTEIIVGPKLKQAFTHRDEASGMVFELVERDHYGGFQDAHVQQLFDALERKNAF